ncbi:MAG: hypothetical protein IPF84_08275 [Proteobacteria bacterium]|nr:hypothetical protein [Pseudomonadota bacterium]
MQHDADIVTVWSAKASTWADFETGKGDVGYYFTQALKYLPKTTQIVHSYPMLPEAVSNRNCQNPEVWDQFARGDFDKYYQTMAQNMKALIVNSGRDPSTCHPEARLGDEWRLVSMVCLQQGQPIQAKLGAGHRYRPVCDARHAG